jgi:hypothetical protein
VFLTLFYTLLDGEPLTLKKNTAKQYFIFKRRGLVSSFYIHVSGSDLYIPRIGLIWNLYFPVLHERTLGSTAGAERRAGNWQRLAAVPCPPLLSCG